VKIENDVAARAWRCRVIETAGDKMIINRGQLDGIREGDAFQGYKLDAAYKQAEPVPDELLLMKYGAKAGKYKVTEAGNLFSKIESADNAPQLSPGDILEQPDIWLKDRKRESRNKRVWDKIYDKK